MPSNVNGIEFIDRPNSRFGSFYLSVRHAKDVLYSDRVDVLKADRRDSFVTAAKKAAPALDESSLKQWVDDVASRALDEGDAEGKPTQAVALASFADGAELFHNGDVAFATFAVEASSNAPAHKETHAAKSKALRLWLVQKFWKAFGKSPGTQALQDALESLEARSVFEGQQLATHVRIAPHGASLYLDLCNEAWTAVEITAAGWRVVADPPVKFIRKRGMLALPAPIAGGSVNELRSLLNLPDDEAWTLVVAWLIGAMNPAGPYPILALNGEQGAAKSTTARILRRMIDPNAADLRSSPKDERDLMIAATNALIVAFDNLSTLPLSLADSLCRLATGGGFSTRELYSDEDEKLFAASRAVLFNGISDLATRPDLLDRAICLHLPSIVGARRTEADIWREFEQVRPRVLGALLDGVSAALRNRAAIKLPFTPRMADFATWVSAAEPALPWPAGAFLKAYLGNRRAVVNLAVEYSPIGLAVISMLSAVPKWTGTAKELGEQLASHSPPDTRRRSDWPANPRALADALRRIAPPLREHGIVVKFNGRTKAGVTIELEQAGESSTPATSNDSIDVAGVDGGVGGVAAVYVDVHPSSSESARTYNAGVHGVGENGPCSKSSVDPLENEGCSDGV